MTLTEIKERLQTANLYQISKKTGITWQTLYNIRQGIGKREPYKSTLKKIENYFQEQNND